MRQSSYINSWLIPALYASCAVVAGFTLPRVESLFFPELISPLSISAATSIYSAIASGMIALTGIVFSLVFVMVQFSATAYSPRLVLWIARDSVMTHALGVFVATFLYALAALAAIDRNSSGRVPIVSGWLAIVLLLASVAMFVALIQRISLLQVNRMLIFTGNQGRKVIDSTYPSIAVPAQFSTVREIQKLSPAQSLIHYGSPRSLQALDIKKLVNLASQSGGTITSPLAIGDTVTDSMALLHVFGVNKPIDDRSLRKAVAIGGERTFEQDPKYAIRLLVDIAIRALSPAINDPTTAVQALDQIEDLLLRLSRRRLEYGQFFDSQGTLRLIIPYPTWKDLLSLSFEEICYCGRTSVQVMRRINALLTDLLASVPEERRPALIVWQNRVRAMIIDGFPDAEGRAEASREDRQGLGGPMV